MDIITDFGSVVLGSSPGGCTYEKAASGPLFSYVHPQQSLGGFASGLEARLS